MMFCNVHCQLVLICLLHKVVWYVLYVIELVMAITVNDVHHMCSNTYIDTGWDNCYRESALLIYHTISQFITCMKCWKQNMDTYALFW